LAVLVFVVVMRRKKGISKADLRVVVLPTPEPRCGIGAMKNVPYLSIHFHARLAHQENYSLEIVKAYLEGRTCVAPFPPVVVAGPYDPSTMIHFGLHRKRVIFPTGFVVSCGVMMRPWNVGKL
jgi:hypothetical protein